MTEHQHMYYLKAFTETKWNVKENNFMFLSQISFMYVDCIGFMICL